MDGDRYCPLGGILRCEDGTPPGYRLPEECITVDCNDADGDVQTWMYFDADGDGEGVGERECVAEGASHYSPETFSTDCDDANPEIFTRQKEIPLDGVDSNCDGLEYPVVDYVAAEDLGVIPLAIPASARCVGVGLSIIGVEIWGNLSTLRTTSSGGIVVVGNRGTETAFGGVLTARYAAEETVSSWDVPPLAPGEMARLGEFPQIGAYSLALDVDTAPDGGDQSDSGHSVDAGVSQDAGVVSSQCAALNREGAIEVPVPAIRRF